MAISYGTLDLLVDTLTQTFNMELPKIKNEDLPQELKEILGDGDAEFESVIDAADFIDVQINPDYYYEGRHETAKLLLESRKQLQEYKRNEIQRYYQRSQEDTEKS